MPNLGHTQAEWTHFAGEEEGYCWLVPMRRLEELANSFLLERIRITNDSDKNNNISYIDLTGVVYGTNTDTQGRIRVRFVANAGNWDVRLYRATGAGAGDLVAHVTNVAAGSTTALIADNSSGIGGTIKIAGSITAEADDVHYLRVWADFRLVAKAFETDADSLTDTNASASYKAMLDAYTAAGNAIRGALAGFTSAFSRFAISDTGVPVAKGRAFLLSADGTVFSESQRTDADGNIVVDQSGLLTTQRVDMLAETTGGTQDVIKRIPSAGAGVFPAANFGLGSVASHTPGEGAQTMSITATCVRGVDTGALGSEEFSISYNYLDKGQRVVRTMPLNLRVNKTWTGLLGIGPISLVRTFSKTGDGADLNLAAVTGATKPTVTGETNSNSDNGVYYWLVVTNGAAFNFEFYKSATYATETLVAKATNVAAAGTINASTQNGSGLTIGMTAGSAPVAGTTGTLNLNPFKVQNASRIADSFTIAVTVAASPGQYQSVVGRMFPGAYLNSDTSGSESISDDYVKAGFPVFADTNP